METSGPIGTCVTYFALLFEKSFPENLDVPPVCVGHLAMWDSWDGPLSAPFIQVRLYIDSFIVYSYIAKL